MTREEAIKRLNYIKTKAEVTLNNSNTSGEWLKEDVRGSINALGMAIDALKREKIYKSTIFKISETLVDESKLHITSEKACEKIREYLKQQDVKLWKLKEVKE